jgi:hypothetical protein
MDCPTGYVATEPWVQADQFFGQNFDIATTTTTTGGSSWDGSGVVGGGPPNNKVSFYYNISNQPVTAVNGATCVDGRVFGQAGPLKPFSQSDARLHVKYIGP